MSAIEERVILSSAGDSRTTAGALASSAWLRELGLTPPRTRWHATVELRAGMDTTWFLEVDASEWGFAFHHRGRTSWIRVTAVPFVHGGDDFVLLTRTPPLRKVGQLVRLLEREHAIDLRGAPAIVIATLPQLVAEARHWVASF